MNGYPVRTEGLGMSYGRTPALHSISLDLAPDRIHGLLGRNAAGKTTLLSGLAALRPASAGTILIGGQDPFENERLMEHICLIRESGDFIPDRRLSSNLRYLQLARPTFDLDYAESLLEAFRLDPRKRAQTLSRGQASAFGAIAGLASRAPLTMFDEVHLGMDAPSRQRFYDELLKDFVEHPRTIILSSHLISEVEHLLETVTILHDGNVLLADEADALRTRGATLTGPSALVDQHADGQTVVGLRDLGPTRQVTVFGDLDEESLRSAQADGIQVGSVPLQDLFIHLTNDEPREGS
ncbi:MAG TPA: ABC transporter ATP-binding protein [Ornithinicoccus sp.]|nr:ABC transporter ATP-binding protein [Ornithinicoccus sp.]